MTTLNDGSIPIWDAKSGKIIQIVAGDPRPLGSGYWRSVAGDSEWSHNNDMFHTQRNPSLIVTDHCVFVWSGWCIIQYKWNEGFLEKVCQKSFFECGLRYPYEDGHQPYVTDPRVVHNILVIYKKSLYCVL